MLGRFACMLLWAVWIGAWAQDAPRELRLSTAQSAAFPIGKAGARWAELVNEKAGSAFEVKLDPGATLAGRDPQREFGVLRDGPVELAVGSALMWSAQLPTFGVYALPWLASEAREQEALVASAAVRERVAARAEAAGVVILALAPLGDRVLSTAKSPVQAPAELAGLRVRAQALPLFLETFAALGARPSAMNFADAQAALAGGTLDGQEGAATTLAATRIAAMGQRYVTRWGAFNDVMIFAVKRATWERWTQAQRTLVRDAAAAAARESDAIAREEAALADLGKQGLTIVRPTPAQRAALRASVQTVWTRWTTQIGADLVAAAEAAVAQPAAK